MKGSAVAYLGSELNEGLLEVEDLVFEVLNLGEEDLELLLVSGLSLLPRHLLHLLHRLPNTAL